jgi:hypothetical protein
LNETRDTANASTPEDASNSFFRCPQATSTADRTAHTLYRNSATGITERIHIATFDASEADSLSENCQQAQVKFWCEKGTYRR